MCPYIFQLIQIPGIKIFRFDCNLYFANAEQFRDRLYERTGLNPKKLKTKKQKALYKALLQRKREIELAEIEEAAALKKEKVNKCRSPAILGGQGKWKWVINWKKAWFKCLQQLLRNWKWRVWIQGENIL